VFAAQGKPGVYANVLEHVGWLHNMVGGVAVSGCLTEVRYESLAYTLTTYVLKHVGWLHNKLGGVAVSSCLTKVRYESLAYTSMC